MIYEREKKVAIEAVKKAAELCKRIQSNLLVNVSISKQDRSPVTIADFGVQSIIISEILESFPDDPIIGEEDSSIIRMTENENLKNNLKDFVQQIKPDMSEKDILNVIDRGDFAGKSVGRQWALDPIDGTKGFLRGDQYAIALALIENGEVVLGVLGCPNLPGNLSKHDPAPGQYYYAVKGEGAYMINPISGSNNRINVDNITDTSTSKFCESVESEHSSHKQSAMIARDLGIKQSPVRIDSQCKYAVVSRGEASIYLRLPTETGYVEKIWDHAAGAIIVEEAGGKVTDIYGKKLDFSQGRTLNRNKGVVVTNGIIHQEVLVVVGKILSL